jgi:hypothetical protein
MRFDSMMGKSTASKPIAPQIGGVVRNLENNIATLLIWVSEISTIDGELRKRTAYPALGCVGRPAFSCPQSQ